MSARFPSARTRRPGVPRVAGDLLEGRHAVGPERFEEGELNLGADDVGRDRVDEAAAEARAGVGRRGPACVRVSPELDRQELGARVEPDQDLAALAVDRVGDPIREHRSRGMRAGVDLMHGQSLERVSGGRSPRTGG